MRHVGRSTGTPFQTPVDAHPTIGGFVLVVRYGPQSDWVRNVLMAGEATLVVDGRDHPVADPRLVDQREAIEHLPSDFDPGRDFFKAEDYLIVDHRT